MIRACWCASKVDWETIQKENPKLTNVPSVLNGSPVIQDFKCDRLKSYCNCASPSAVKKLSGKRARGRPQKLPLIVDRGVQATCSRSKQKEVKDMQSEAVELLLSSSIMVNQKTEDPNS
ncbi:hypothetical protein HAX54_028947 [Datura stramonium]|uniref:Uncharacterized protein n=1 Tax=Datura stramonium TaxID=4076 RepID=A0ABS8V7C5_DATST|nr:hypothetical protein [Datura stramonium]